MDAKSEIITRSKMLFLRVGVKSVSMDDVSKELGISKKTLYQHFENKENLVEAVISAHINHENDCMEHICHSAADALDEVRNIGNFIAQTVENISPATLYDLEKYHHRSWEMLMQKQDKNGEQCVMRNIQRGIAEGLYRPGLEVEIVAKIFSKAIFMVIEEISNPASRHSRRKLIWELHNYHIHAIANEKGLARWKKYSAEYNHLDSNSIPS